MPAINRPARRIVARFFTDLTIALEAARAPSTRGAQRGRGEDGAGPATPERIGAGYGASWRRARLAFLARYPLCASCQAEGRLVPATVVDHVVPHRGDQRLFWEQTNWAPACKRCHDAKTAREGRWG